MNGAKLAWTPWHKVVQLRDDLKSGELSLATFAADLYDVTMGRARKVYQDPAEFFALTYPTFNLRELAKDVIQRLAGRNDKAIRQLELTYGGGKTHTLITMRHLVHDPRALPDIPAVREFIEHAGMTPPKARVAVLAFDKLDVEKGMEIVDPAGNKRWLKQPWSVLAWQIAGADGLKLLNAEGKAEERDSAPAENLMAPLLALPGQQDLSTLILLDEVLMYAREKVGFDEAWRSRLQNFFQYLTQAATKVDRCAIVASLLATDPNKSDRLGKEITQELYAIFRREREEGVQPVVKEDVAEVLRRRFFKPESIRDREVFRPHAVAALKGITALDEQTRKDAKKAEERLINSYPLNPDLTDVFYSKWTSLEGFQRTRGVLRTFALALREAEKWDPSPLVGANVFLSAPGSEDISEGLRELTGIATAEEYEGKRQEWTSIIQSELQKARIIQDELPALKYREIEQGVVATFLHSQPIGQKASTADLMTLLGHTRPDKIELEKALLRWTELSWFLDEAAIQMTEPGAARPLPKAWRLGSRPNLRQMHNDGCTRVSPDLVETKLIDAISKTKSLTAGASAAGARTHNLPAKPSDIEDDGELHYAVLGPRAASMSGNPSVEAKRFIEETTGPDRPRTYRNAIVLAVPSRDGLEAARNQIREYLGWEEVKLMLKGQEIDALRVELLNGYTETARKKITEVVQKAYCIVIAVSDKNEIQAFKLAPTEEPLFNIIKGDPRSRIQDAAISADAMLPEGPYNLWRDDESSRRVKDLVGAFAQFPHLPKMLRRQEIINTLVQGAREGFFVLQATRPDRSVRTVWRQEPVDADLKDPSLELVLSDKAVLTEVLSDLLIPGNLPGLWPDTQEITVADVFNYFRGGHVVSVKRDGYEEPMTIPKADRGTVEKALTAAIQTGRIWLLAGTASILGELVPTGVLVDSAQLLPPVAPISPMDLLPANLPSAWQEGQTSAIGISIALSQKAGRNLPWSTVREAIDGAVRARLLEKAPDSGPWPCDAVGAQLVKLTLPSADVTPPLVPPIRTVPRASGVKIAEAELKPNEFQDLSDKIGEVLGAAVGCELKLFVRMELRASADSIPDNTISAINTMLADVSRRLQLQ